MQLAALSAGKPVLRRILLSLETLCQTPNGKCRIKGWTPAPTKNAPVIYQVEFETGLAATIPETGLIPLEVPRPNTPLEVLRELELDGYGTFQMREAMAEAWRQVVRGGLGVRALLSSRIDLRPHQAYVAGTVLLDWQQRYLLADEVGLGKTIEAGIIIHDLLGRRPEANVLVLCPSTLAQQWLCELYAKFSGRVFQLPELHPAGHPPGTGAIQWIVSFTSALSLSQRLLETRWDLVVVDEAHHLLGAPPLYELARSLSRVAPGYLLLSAIPAQHREDEYLRLLALLEPHRYDPSAPEAKERFKALYRHQIEIGRKIGYISRRLSGFATGKEGHERILPKIRELTTLPVLAQDEVLHGMANRLDPAAADFADQTQALLHYVGDRYRISRRILRNRRSQLIEIEPDLRITRRLNRIPCQPEQLELDARVAVRQLLLSLRAAGISIQTLLALARQLLQSLCDPVCLANVLALARKPVGSLDEARFALATHIGYAEWTDHVSALWRTVDPFLAEELMHRVRVSAGAWSANAETTPRINALVGFLRRRHRQARRQKFLIFAGFPGAAQRVASVLTQEFGPTALAQFGWEMDSKAKERNVHRFRRDNECWILVSDETGGEGRNFQFANELIHYDLPWHVARIEQRIGRLDRLGREQPDVCSNVIFTRGEEEENLLDCLESGFEIFTRSVSGLEFALSELEARMVLAAIDEGCDSLNPLVAEIKSKADAERAEDDALCVLDVASLERSKAEAFKRVQSTPERDVALENAFHRYFTFLAGSNAARFVRGNDGVDGIIEFRPDQARGIDLSLRPGLNGAPPDRLGTFRRALAQERPDLEFFSVGNEFFDAVCAILHRSPQGRSYAVECLADHTAWRGFEFAYRPTGCREIVAAHPWLSNDLGRIFGVKTEHCFIGEDLQPARDDLNLLTIRKSLRPEDKNQNWWNFTLKNTRVQLLANRYANPGWTKLVTEAECHGSRVARARLVESLAPDLDAERVRIEEQIRQLRVSRTIDWEDEVTALELLLKALSNWELELVIAGFFSVNGGLLL